MSHPSSLILHPSSLILHPYRSHACEVLLRAKDHGKHVFESHKCASCHGDIKTGSPTLAGLAKPFTTMNMVSVLWSHGPQMLDRMAGKGILFTLQRRSSGQSMLHVTPSATLTQAGNTIIDNSATGHTRRGCPSRICRARATRRYSQVAAMPPKNASSTKACAGIQAIVGRISPRLDR